jgi:hypothetical protein
MLLAALTPALSPTWAAQQLTESAPMLSQPVLSFDGTPWQAHSANPVQYLVGLTKIAGMAESDAAVVAARPNATRDSKGGAAQRVDVVEWRGKRVKLTARLKRQDATEVQIVMDVVSGAAPGRQTTQTMVTPALSGTRDWQVQEIVMDVPADATDIVYGFYLRGHGAAFGDSFKLEAVGRNIALTRAPNAPSQFTGPGLVRSRSSVEDMYGSGPRGGLVGR